MLDGRTPDRLCPDEGNTWTRLGAYCTGLLDQVAAGQQLHPIPGRMRPSIARRTPVRTEPRQPPVTKEPRMNAPIGVPTIPISFELAAELLKMPNEPFELVAEAPGIHISFTAVVQAAAAPAPVETVPTSTPRPVKPQATKQDGSTGDEACDECPRKFGTVHALAVHRARTHGHKKIKPSRVGDASRSVEVPVTRRVTPPANNGSEATPPPILQDTTTPISRMKFDPDRTRAAAAASI
jgi:hypothetical protein